MQVSNRFVFNVPTKALVGLGTLNDLHTEINTDGGAVQGKKAMVVISRGRSVQRTGTLQRVEEQLEWAGVSYVLFDEIGANPVKSMVEKGR